jgi:hypothetical protein
MLFFDAYCEMRGLTEVSYLRDEWEENFSENYNGIILERAYELFCDGVHPSEMDEAQQKYDDVFLLLDWLDANEEDGFGRIWRGFDRLLGPYLDGTYPVMQYPFIHGTTDSRNSERTGVFYVADSEECLGETKDNAGSRDYATGH